MLHNPEFRYCIWDFIMPLSEHKYSDKWTHMVENKCYRITPREFYLNRIHNIFLGLLHLKLIILYVPSLLRYGWIIKKLNRLDISMVSSKLWFTYLWTSTYHDFFFMKYKWRANIAMKLLFPFPMFRLNYRRIYINSRFWVYLIAEDTIWSF